MKKLGPDVAIDVAEAKILKHRVETSMASPGILAMLAMLGLTLFCYLVGRSDLMAVVCTLLLGSGVFLYSLSRTVDRLAAIQKAMKLTEMRLLNGEIKDTLTVSKTSDGKFWTINTSDGPAYRLPVPNDETSVIMVNGPRLYNLWVDRRLKSEGGLLQAGIPPIRDEMRRSSKAIRGRDRLENGQGTLPALLMEENRGFKIAGGEEELMGLIASRAVVFPVIAADAITAELLQKHATP